MFDDTKQLFKSAAQKVEKSVYDVYENITHPIQRLEKFLDPSNESPFSTTKETPVSQRQEELRAPSKDRPTTTPTPKEVERRLTEESLAKTKNFSMEMAMSFGPQALENVGAKIVQKFAKHVSGPRVQKMEEMTPPPLPKKPITTSQGTSDYIKQQIEKQKTAKDKGIVTGAIEKTKSFIAEAKSKIVDYNAPIEDTLGKTLKDRKMSLLPQADITNQIDRVLNAPRLAGSFMRSNGLEDVIKNVDNYDEFNQFLISRHALDVNTRGIETGRDFNMDSAVVKELAPHYEDMAKRVTDYSQRLLDHAVDSGIIPKDLATELKTRYPNYVPMNRVFSEIEKQSGPRGAGGVSSISSQSVLKALKGSEREVENPLESLTARTVDTITQGEKNKAANILSSYEHLPGNPFQMRVLEKGENPLSGMGVVSHFENGELVRVETTKEVEQAAKLLDVQQLNILGKILAAPVRIAKVGITGINPAFIASNIPRDQISAMINSNHALATSVANPHIFMRSLMSVLKHDDIYNDVMKQGVGGTSFDVMRSQVVPTVEKIRAGKSISSKALYIAKNPSELLRSVENIIGKSEELTRMQQFLGTKSELMKKGWPEADANIMASRAHRENTVNFARMGEWGKVLNSAFLYLNPAIQGTRTLLRNMENKPIATSSKIAVGVFTPIAMASLWNLSDEKRRQAYLDTQEFERQGNIIIVPPNPIKDEKTGRWNIIKIPISQEIQGISNIPRRFIEQAYDMDSVKMSEVAADFMGTVSPISGNPSQALGQVIPQAIKPTAQSVANYDFFTGRPIVPRSLEGLPTEKQVTKYTTGTAKTIGDKLGIAPVKVDKFLRDTFGTIAPIAERGTDIALSKAGVIKPEEVKGQGIGEAVSARFMSAAGGAIEEKNYNKAADALKEQKGEKNKIKIQAEEEYAKIKEMAKTDKNAAKKYATGLEETNPDLADEIMSVADNESKGLTSSDRVIKQMTISNGDRAKFFYDQMKNFKKKDEKLMYLQYMQDKELLTDEVFDQLSELLSKGK